MHDENDVTLARELLTSMILGLLSAMRMTKKSDDVNVEVMFSPQVFNPENRTKRRRYVFIITACIKPAFEEGKNG